MSASSKMDQGHRHGPLSGREMIQAARTQEGGQGDRSVRPFFPVPIQAHPAALTSHDRSIRI